MAEEIPSKLRIQTPDDLYQLVGHIQKWIEQGILQKTTGNCDLDAIKPTNPWPADHITMTFKHATTGVEYELSCNTYHGLGGDWQRKTKEP